jgi:simple sugar transport system ATP-binding protein
MKKDGHLPLVRMKGITKHFGGVQALDRINFDVNHKEIVGLVGDNGAGKSTLMKVLSGVYHPDGGEIFFEDKKVDFTDPLNAKKRGIEMVYQDLALCDNMSIPENIFLAREPLKKFFWGLVKTIDVKQMNQESEKILRRLKISVKNIKTKVNTLSGGQRKAVAIGRALFHQAKLIILDEPTAALAVKEIEKVLALIQQLRERGISVIFISHNLQEVLSAVDKIVVLRAGKLAGVKKKAETNIEEIVSLMVGGK